MVKKTLIICLTVLALNFQAFGGAWYSQNFDKFNDGDIVGQDDWNTAMGQKTCQIPGKVKHGEMDNSVLVAEKTMVVRMFQRFQC